MSEQGIVNAIDGYISSNYSKWTVGITSHPDDRKQAHGSPASWHCWDADTEIIARRIEKYFLDKGCKGDTGGGFAPHYVYIF